jgi:beta-glucosidase
MHYFVAVKLDGCQVLAYTARSLMDDFDWDEGYSSTFGLFQVDFKSPDGARPRIAKDSVAFYKQLISDNGWPKANKSLN